MKLSFTLKGEEKNYKQKTELYCFLYLSMYLPLPAFSVFFFLNVYLIYCLVSFYFIMSDSLNISYRAVQLVTNSLSFCLSGNTLISPQFWKIVLLDIEFLLDKSLSFSFSTLNMLFHCLLASMVSDKNWILIFMISSTWWITSSWCFQDLLFAFQ